MRKHLFVFIVCLFAATSFCSAQKGNAASIMTSINVYFPNSEVQADAKKLNLNVQGVIVSIPLCDVDIAAVDEHNFQFTAKGKENIMRGSDATKSVKLTLVHSACAKFVDLLTSLQKAVCG